LEVRGICCGARFAVHVAKTPPLQNGIATPRLVLASLRAHVHLMPFDDESHERGGARVAAGVLIRFGLAIMVMEMVLEWRGGQRSAQPISAPDGQRIPSASRRPKCPGRSTYSWARRKSLLVGQIKHLGFSGTLARPAAGGFDFGLDTFRA